MTDGDDGTPIAGAVVKQPLTSASAVTTDGNGSYALAAVVNFGDFGTEVWISKPGYEDTHGWATSSADGRYDFKLYRPVNMTAGAAIRLAITADNSLCGFDDEYRCRIVRVAAPSSGTLIVETTADNPADPLWVVAGTDVVQYPVTQATSLRVAAAAGGTIPVLIFRGWSPPPADTGTIRTALLPN